MIVVPVALLAILYAGGYLAQFIHNYNTWKNSGGYPGDGTAPLMPDAEFLICLQSVIRTPYGFWGIVICVGLLALLLIMVMRMGYSDTGEYDEARNFTYSAKGTYGTSGWMSEKEMNTEFDFSGDPSKKERHWGRDKNLRDIWVHLYEWHQMLLKFVR